MKKYNKEIPLLSIHIPKTGGTSFEESLKIWFEKKLFRHYVPDKSDSLPEKIKLKKWYSNHYIKEVCIHGHFNGNRGFGVDDYYPEIKQAITFLRDPLERALSLYFYSHRLIKEGRNYRAGKKFEMTNDIDQFLRNFHSGIKYFFPKAISLESIDTFVNDYFVHIGVMDHYQKSMDILAEKLDKPKVKISHKNISNRTQYPSEGSIRKFKENNKFEYALYEKALKLNNF